MSKLNELTSAVIEIILECLEKVLGIKGKEKEDLESYRKILKKWEELKNIKVNYTISEKGSKTSFLRNLNYYLIFLIDCNRGRIAEFYKYLDEIFKKLSDTKKIGEYEALIVKIAIIIAVCENDMSVLYTKNIVNILESLEIFETTKESKEFMDELLPMLRQELSILAKEMEIYLLRAAEECC